ncbi:type I polyketide synthase, partial [Longimicrobium sp.]|uniref:type I polyketide synthase n=1 Tax=Longimicrobium sp. TaxID=2029185 RepID=UPI002E3294A5
KGQGTVPGSGAGVVVLKRLSDALADGDRVLAVMLGSALNNDGSNKVGFTAPSVDGQIDVITMAQAVAGVEPESITYIEAHGTGTSMGDPIEITALTRAFDTDARGYCAIGSVKSNVGHLDCAAGVAGVIKTVLAMNAGQIPASLHYEAPNPAIDFDASPFYVNARLSPWERQGGFPRRAGISALGVGGTNAHVILEEAPARPAPSAPASDPETIVLSARTSIALERLSASLAAHLEAHPELRLADVAFTLQQGRRVFSHRRAFAARDVAEAVARLRRPHTPAVATFEAPATDPGVVFAFPGAGSVTNGTARALYRRDADFRAAFDRCADVLRARAGMDLRAALHGDRPELLRETAYADAAVFAVGWALAQAWRARGVEPRAVLGHGLGELAAACAAGVFSLEDALGLVLQRARLVDGLPESGARVVTMDADRVRALVAELAAGGLWVSAHNATHSTVVCGTTAALDALAARVRAEGGISRPLDVRRPMHCAALAGIRDAFASAVSAARRGAPGVPLVSGATGEWLRPEQAQSAAYWAEALVSPVRYDRAVARVREDGAEPVLLEMGAGQLGDWARLSGAPRVTASLSTDADRDEAAMEGALGYLWAAGVAIDWTGQPRTDARRVALPGHPMERRRYWLDVAADAPVGATEDALQPASRWVYAPEWRQCDAPRRPVGDALAGRRIVAFTGAEGAAVLDGLRALGADVVRVAAGADYAEGAGAFTVRPGAREDFARLAGALRGADGPVHTLHLWGLEDDGADPSPVARALLHWLDAAATAGLLPEGASVTVATAGAQPVLGPELVHPARALLTGGVRGAAEERPGLHCRAVDFAAGPVPADLLLAEVADAVRAAPGAVEAAYRGRRRWTARLLEVAAEPDLSPSARLRQGAWVVTGGLRGTGNAVARYLARHGARLALVEPEDGAHGADALHPLDEATDVLHALGAAGL